MPGISLGPVWRDAAMSPAVNDKSKMSVKERFMDTSSIWGINLEMVQMELRR